MDSISLDHRFFFKPFPRLCLLIGILIPFIFNIIPVMKEFILAILLFTLHMSYILLYSSVPPLLTYFVLNRYFLEYHFNSIFLFLLLYILSYFHSWFPWELQLTSHKNLVWINIYLISIAYKILLWYSSISSLLLCTIVVLQITSLYISL